MGAVFSVPWSRLESWPTDLSDVRRDGLTVLALTPAPDATPLADLPPSVTARCALLIGAEGPGLTQAALDAADHRVRIPMSGGVDSLNAAAAAAVAFYALAQSRR
jgi:tRNA G18 (ribose-2'-O)-methylase SpoU